MAFIDKTSRRNISGNRFSSPTCIGAIGSLTLCMKAQNALQSAAILSYVEKLGAADTRRGCAYGIRFYCQEQANVERVLHAVGIRPKSFRPE